MKWPISKEWKDIKQTTNENISELPIGTCKVNWEKKVALCNINGDFEKKYF